MDPPPGSLNERISNNSDDYLYWRIAEGGMNEPFNSLMPAWGNILDSEQIWQVVSYIRTLDD
jgi:mono/diheme cytochrome c family protein